MSKEQSPELSEQLRIELKIAARRRKTREEVQRRRYQRMNVEDVLVTMTVNGKLVL